MSDTNLIPEENPSFANGDNGLEKNQITMVKDNENDNENINKTFANPKASNNDINHNLETELNQLETNVTELTNNFKKRRLSKNEMDFLESELNLDLTTITDADFDIHIQKLMADNDHNIVNSNIEKTNDKVTESNSVINFVENIENDKSNSGVVSNSDTYKDEKEITNNELKNDSVTKTDPIENDKQEQELFVKELSVNDNESKITNENNTLDEQNKVPRKADQQSETNNNEDSKNNKIEKTEQVKPTTVNDSEKNTDAKKITISKTTTDTYKGVSIPANSELFRLNDTDSVLQAYRDLINDSNRSKVKASHHINAQLSALPLLITAPDHLSFNVQMLINTLPVLDNLSTQILRIIAKGPYQKVMELVSNRESYAGIAFGNLVELFETTKRVYNSEESPFFTVENVTFGLWKYGEQAPSFLRGREDTIEGILRKVNLCTFLLATLGLIDLGFFFLNEAFLDVFCPPQNLEPSSSLTFVKDENFLTSWTKDMKSIKIQRNQTKFLKPQAILYLELKTQAYISAIELGDRSKEDIIHDLFPDNMDEILLRRKDPYFDVSGIKVERNSALFTPAELDFLSRCDFRKQTLLNSEADSTLMEKYEWIKFLNDLLEYVSKNIGFLIWGPKGKLSSELERLENMNKLKETEMNYLTARTNFDKNKITKSSVSDIEDSINSRKNANKNDFKDEDHEITNTEGNQKRNNEEMDNGEDNSNNSKTNNDGSSSNITIKPVKRQKVNRPSTFRRVWTAEEEETLKKGLIQKGTHWTAILELYGPGGTINENLKNRSSLQLKDKARNWKLYYIKNKLPIPSYLQKEDSNKLKKSQTKKIDSTTMNSEPKSNEFNNTDPDVYNQMLDNLLPNVKDDEKLSVVNDDAVASELKDLVAEAFK